MIQVGYLTDVLLETLMWLADLASGIIFNIRAIVSTIKPLLFFKELVIPSTKLTKKWN